MHAAGGVSTEASAGVVGTGHEKQDTRRRHAAELSLGDDATAVGMELLLLL
jgi:hypothetical protein